MNRAIVVVITAALIATSAVHAFAATPRINTPAIKLTSSVHRTTINLTRLKLRLPAAANTTFRVKP